MYKKSPARGRVKKKFSVGGLNKKVDRLKRRVGGIITKRFGGLKKKIDGLQKRVGRLQKRVDGLKKRVG